MANEQLEKPPLDQLAEMVGILPEFTDKMGIVHKTPDDLKRAFLQAMGIPANSDFAISNSLRELEEKPWREIVPAVKVVRTDLEEYSLQIDVHFPEMGRAGNMNWAVTFEDGRVVRGATQPFEMQIQSRRTMASQVYERRRFRLPVPLPRGYHKLKVAFSGLSAETTIVIAPHLCYVPQWIGGDIHKPGKIWGFPVQAYALRSGRNWGIGDFTDLARFAKMSAELGAGILGINPLGAAFQDDPENACPYSVSNRLFLNCLYIDIRAVPELFDCPQLVALIDSKEFQAKLQAIRSKDWLDYTSVMALKMPVLEALFRTFKDKPHSKRRHAFNDFRQSRGEALDTFSLYQALAEHIGKGKPAPGWRQWPLPYRNPKSPETRRFAEEHAEKIEFYAWLQFETDRQLAAVAEVCHATHMAIGLYPDMAVGAAAEGAETWAHQDWYVHGFYAGAPADLRRPRGQNWGVAPFSPLALKDLAYQPFREMVRQLMKYAGALRLDHAAGLNRLYWTGPDDKKSRTVPGAYVSYPLDDLLGILALESHRAQCMVVGEDLGTVPAEFTEKMHEAGILSCRVLTRQCRNSVFYAPKDYLPNAAVSFGTHDQATIHGYWSGHDLGLYQKYDLAVSPEWMKEALETRSKDRAGIINAFDAAGVWLNGHKVGPDLSEDILSGKVQPAGFVEAAMRFLAHTPSAILLVQLEDLLGQVEQVNLPGTMREYPNWRRRLPVALEDMMSHPVFRAVVEMLKKERP